MTVYIRGYENSLWLKIQAFFPVKTRPKQFFFLFTHWALISWIFVFNVVLTHQQMRKVLNEVRILGGNTLHLYALIKATNCTT